MKKLTIIKIGGNVIDNEKSLNKFLVSFSKIKGYRILVHGGGKLATQVSSQLGIETKMVDGRRITDSETLKVTTMVYAGWINKSISAKLNAHNLKAIGLCGADAFIIPSNKRKNKAINYGFVGDVISNKINTKTILKLLEMKLVPVMAPITADFKGQLLNTNADTMASSLAIALSKHFETTLIYCFEKDGVLNNNLPLKTINPIEYKNLKIKAIINEGMVPKLDNAFLAINKGAKNVLIGNSNHLTKLITNHAGTRITK